MATVWYHRNMTQKRISKEEREAYALVGRKGGKAIAKKLGKRGMSALGKKGAAKRWPKGPARDEQGRFS